MNRNTLARRTVVPVLGSAALLALATAAGLWWALGRGSLPGLLAAAALALLAALAAVWFVRARDARRWNAAMDAYAKRELARAGARRRSGSHVA